MDFNPHSHEGSDMCLSKSNNVSVHISIHTPTKGATDNTLSHHHFLRNFNPHSHEGSDRPETRNQYRNTNFNPHSHEGSDTTLQNSAESPMNFNPHSHEGSDVIESNDTSIATVFQSTLPRRERREHCFSACII